MINPTQSQPWLNNPISVGYAWMPGMIKGALCSVAMFDPSPGSILSGTFSPIFKAKLAQDPTLYWPLDANATTLTSSLSVTLSTRAEVIDLDDGQGFKVRQVKAYPLLNIVGINYNKVIVFVGTTYVVFITPNGIVIE